MISCYFREREKKNSILSKSFFNFTKCSNLKFLFADCKVINGPIITIAWYKDGIPLVLNDRTNLSQSGTLTITELNKDTDAGLYTCIASTKNGKSTWSAYLKLEAPTNPNIRFYRAPEASTFPGQPGNLEMSFFLFLPTHLLVVRRKMPSQLRFGNGTQIN